MQGSARCDACIIIQARTKGTSRSGSGLASTCCNSCHSSNDICGKEVGSTISSVLDAAVLWECASVAMRPQLREAAATSACCCCPVPTAADPLWACMVRRLTKTPIRHSSKLLCRQVSSHAFAGWWIAAPLLLLAVGPAACNQQVADSAELVESSSPRKVTDFELQQSG